MNNAFAMWNKITIFAPLSRNRCHEVLLDMLRCNDKQFNL